MKIKAQHNNSMDVRAKQRLSFRVVFLPLTVLVAVSARVNAAVMLLVECLL